jgi:receptor expression-enhancing protein 5/6
MGAAILTVIITVVYPAVQSIKALESKEGDDDKTWLTYWVVFGVFTLLDEFVGFILEYIPFYFYLRLAFFLYLMAP